MKVRVTRSAGQQIGRILALIEIQSPTGAGKVRHRLMAAFRLLETHPHAGRPTDRPRVRRVALVPYPYVISYLVDADAILVLAVRHPARRPHPLA